MTFNLVITYSSFQQIILYYYICKDLNGVCLKDHQNLYHITTN